MVPRGFLMYDVSWVSHEKAEKLIFRVLQLGPFNSHGKCAKNCANYQSLFYITFL